MRKLLLVLLSGLLISESALACTAVNIEAKDGTVVAGRTMEWALNMGWQLQYVPKGTSFKLVAPNNLDLPALNVTSKYALVGISTAMVDGAFLDGQNEKGLAVSGNFLPGFTEYESVVKTDKNYMSILQAIQFILSSYATVDEAKQNLPNYKIWGASVPKLGFIPTIHLLVTDKTGNDMVIEFIDGKMVIFDKTNGVMTNAPNYDWHTTNLRNYLNLSNTGAYVKPSNDDNLNAVNITSLGQGSGGIGLPGDYTSPSRFVKTSYLKYFAKQPQNSIEAVQQVDHLLNNVDISNGSVTEANGGHIMDEVTQWIVLKDLSNNQLYLSDYNHRTNFAQNDLNEVFKLAKPMKININNIAYPTSKINNPFAN